MSTKGYSIIREPEPSWVSLQNQVSKPAQVFCCRLTKKKVLGFGTLHVLVLRSFFRKSSCTLSRLYSWLLAWGLLCLVVVEAFLVCSRVCVLKLRFSLELGLKLLFGSWSTGLRRWFGGFVDKSSQIDDVISRF